MQPLKINLILIVKNCNVHCLQIVSFLLTGILLGGLSWLNGDILYKQCILLIWEYWWGLPSSSKWSHSNKKLHNGFLFVCFLGLFLSFLGPHLRHMEILRLGSNQSHNCQPTPQSQQGGIWAVSASHTIAHGNAGSILNPLNEARDQTLVFMDTSRVHYRWAMTGTLKLHNVNYLCLGPFLCPLRILKFSLWEKNTPCNSILVLMHFMEVFVF